MTKKPTVKSLQKRAEKLWKEYAYKRDGKECMVERHFPDIEIWHSSVYQVDHCISRKNKLLFLDTRNSTVVCSSCNSAKAFNNKSVSRAIDEIVKKREGISVFNEMVKLDQKKCPNPNWNKIWWLENMIDELIKKTEKDFPKIEKGTIKKWMK